MACIKCGHPTWPGLELCDACYQALRERPREPDPRLKRTGTGRRSTETGTGARRRGGKKARRDAGKRDARRGSPRHERRRTTCFVGFRYDKPGHVHRLEHYRKPGGGAYDKRTGFKGFLKYVEFREGQRDEDDYIAREEREVRWMDGGLGNNYRDIYQRCAELQSRSVFGRRLVVSPDPRLMESLREADPDTYARRRELFIQAVENTIEGWADEKGINLEYAFVIHAPQRDPAERGYGEQLHAHIILPGSTDELGEIVPFYHSREEEDRFQEIAEAELERTFGFERLREQEVAQEVRQPPPEPQLEIEL